MTNGIPVVLVIRGGVGNARERKSRGGVRNGVGENRTRYIKKRDTPSPNRVAIVGPNRKPRASKPAIFVGLSVSDDDFSYRSTNTSTTALNAFGFSQMPLTS